MKNLFKITMVMFVAAATMLTFASCDKEDSDSNPINNTSTDNSTVVADTEWKWKIEDPNGVSGIIDISVEFTGSRLAGLTYTDMSTGVMQTYVLIGSYSYSNGAGSLELEDDFNNTTVNATFTISGTSMTLNFKGSVYSLKKK